MTSPPRLLVTTLGSVDVAHDGVAAELQPGQRQILALLVAAGPTGATTEWLAEECWGERLPKEWRASIRVAISRLRKRAALDVHLLNGRYRLVVATNEIDVWCLAAVVAGEPALDDELSVLLRSPVAYPDLELSPALLQSAAEITRHQRLLIRRLADEGRRLDPTTLGRLELHLTDDPYDDELLRAVAELYAASDEVAQALRLLDARRATRGTVENDQLGALATRLRQRWTSPLPNDIDGQSGRVADHAAFPLPPELARRRTVPFVGRETELSALLDLVETSGRSVVVRGPPGSGKSALLAEAASAIRRRGVTVASMSGLAGRATAFGPICAAVRGFDLDLASTELVTRQLYLPELARKLRSRLEVAAAGAPIVLIIDDAHLLDTSTCDLLELLCVPAGDPALRLVFASHDGPLGLTAWGALETNLERMDASAPLDLDPLSVDAVTHLAGELRPELGLGERTQFGRWLHRASGGLPLVVRWSMWSDQRETSDSDPGDIGGGRARAAVAEAGAVFERIVRGLPDDQRRVGAAAAVLGPRFVLAELIELVGMDETELFLTLDALTLGGHMGETGLVDEFEFTHALIARAFLGSMTVSHRCRLHLRAADLTDDVHALARHHTEAKAFLPAELVVESILASARAHLQGGSFWESAAAFRAAIGIGEEPLLTARDLVDFATALSLSGQRARSSEIRRRAFDLARSEADWAVAFDAAVSGLPEADVADGEIDRLVQLESLPDVDLDRPRRLGRAALAARISAQLGEARRGRALGRRGEHARNATEREGGSSARRVVCRRHRYASLGATAVAGSHRGRRHHRSAPVPPRRAARHRSVRDRPARRGVRRREALRSAR